MKKKIFFLVCFFSITNFFSQIVNKDIVDSSFIYGLPTEIGKKVFISQGYNGWFSHKNQFAIDFKLKEGSPIFAARDGIVHRCVASNNVGGMRKKYLSKGNHIIIEHADGTFAAYWHLKYEGVLVKKGDKVLKGQHIGFSGNTGYSTSSHLHFEVYFFNEQGKQVTVRTPFETSKGIRQLKAYRCYRR